MPEIDTDSFRPVSLYRIGAIAALLQLLTTLSFFLLPSLAFRPEHASTFFKLVGANPFNGLIYGDFSSLLVIFLYLFTFPAIAFALRKTDLLFATYAAAFAIIAAILCFSTHSGFSLIHLSKLFTATEDAITRSQLLAAGQTAIASNMWHSTAGYISGFLLQGAGVIISVVMMRGKEFSRWTAWAGLLSNGLDLVQHIIHPFAPEKLCLYILYAAGPFYLFWFPLLSLDLFKLAKRNAVHE